MIALARKYRPKKFAEVAVQSHVANTLRGAIASGRLAHGYLFCGPRGTGKTTLARVLAMALNCETNAASRRLLAQGAGAGAGGDRGSNETRLAADGGEPCGKCISCTRIWNGSASLDVVEIDAASNRGVDDARDLRERAMYAPSGDDRYKVYIVDEAHMLTREAWNALLKILEEPPPRVVFVFATTEPHKIAQAAAPVLSRLQRFDLKRIGVPEIRERLNQVLGAEGVRAEPDAVAMLARAGDGSMRDALSLTDQALALGDGTITTARVRESLGLVPDEELIEVLDLIAAGRGGDVFTVVARLSDAGIDFGVFFGGIAETIRAQLAVELGSTPDDLSERMRDGLVERRGRMAAPDLLRMLNIIGEIEPRFRRSGQQRLLIETLLVRLALLDRSVSLEDVLRGIAGGIAGGSAGERATVAKAIPEPRGTQGSSTGSRKLSDAGGRALADVGSRTLTDTGSLKLADESVRPRIEVQREPAAAPRALPASPPDLARLTEQWDDIVADLRRTRPMLASVLERSIPATVTAAGVVTLDPSDEAASRALVSAKDEVLAAVRARAPGVSRVALRTPDSGAQQAPARRITEESVREERIKRLRSTDPILAAAFDELDLDLIE